MKSILHLLEGDQTLGRGPRFWCTALVVLVGALVFGGLASSFAVDTASYFLVWVFMALGLALMWGLSGTLSFGQTAFFGLGGYCYAIVATNFGPDNGLTLVALLLSVFLVAVIAAIVGLFMFFGGARGVFVSIITLAISLSLETFLSQTAGPQWKLGSALIGGFNGITSMPPITIPWFGSDYEVTGRAFYYAIVAVLVLTYLALRIVGNSRFGDAMVAVRENPRRAEALGYNVKAVLLAAFVLGSSLAGVSGVAFTTWGLYVSPDTMGLAAAAMPIVWTAVSGKDLTATFIGTILLLALSQTLAIYGSQYAYVALGVVLIASVLTCPEGIVEKAMRLSLSQSGPGNKVRTTSRARWRNA